MFPIQSSDIPPYVLYDRSVYEGIEKRHYHEQRRIQAKACELEEKFINRAGTCLGILASDGVLLAKQERNTNSKRKAKASSRRIEAEIYQIDENIACGIIGNTSEAKKEVEESRKAASWRRKSVNKLDDVPNVPLNLLHLRSNIGWPWPWETPVAGLKWLGTTTPYRIALIYMAWSKTLGYQLAKDDYAGTARNLKTVCKGNNSIAIASYLQEECKDGKITLNDAKLLAVKALCKNSNECELSSDSVKIVTLKQVRSKPIMEIIPSKDLETLIKTCKEQEHEKTKNGAQAAKEPPRKRKRKTN